MCVWTVEQRSSLHNEEANVDVVNNSDSLVSGLDELSLEVE